jgi:hypothetical protein
LLDEKQGNPALERRQHILDGGDEIGQDSFGRFVEDPYGPISDHRFLSGNAK